MRIRSYRWSVRLIKASFLIKRLPVNISWLFVAGVLFQYCSGNPKALRSTITLTIENAYNQEIIIERKGIFGDRDSIIKKVFPKDRVETVSVSLIDSMERLYYIRSSDARVTVYFINDGQSIDARIDYMDPTQFQFTGSPATSSLHAYLASVESIQQHQKPKPSPFGIGTSGANFNRIAYDYVDTVASPAAALMIYNSIDFGKDFPAIKSFVTKLAKRFPNHAGIQELKVQTFEYLRIFEQDLAKGQEAPHVQLTDTANQTHSVHFNASELTLIDICSSWYGPCLLRYDHLKKLRTVFADSTLQMVSVSMDADRSDWASSIKYLKPDWLQLRDSLVWQGPTIKNYLFDSIPYNFLVSKEGKILDYAIPVDSLSIKIQGYLR